jgi:hypothetical protein
MSGMAEITISLDTFKALEASRLSFTETHDDIIRRMTSAAKSRSRAPLRQASRATPPARRRRGDVKLTMFGRETAVASLKYGYVAALQGLARHKPALFEILSQRGTIKRKWAAREAEALFPGSPHLARDHAHPVAGEWLIDTNLSRAQIEARLAVACHAAGYRYGEDVLLSAG